jgi:FkbM family methyltransferase
MNFIINKFFNFASLLRLNIDADLHLAKMGLNVLVVDPTPRAISYVQSRLKSPTYNMSLLPVGIWTAAGNLPFYFPRNEQHVSLSAANLQKTQNYLYLPVLPIEDILVGYMDLNLSILKLDIEGIAPVVLLDILKKKYIFQYILVDFEYPTKWGQYLRVIWKLKRTGYSLYKINNRDFHFLLK